VIVALSTAWVGVIGATTGAAIGIVGGGVTTWLVEKARWERENLIRWHPERRRAYVRFLQAADDYTRAGRRLTDELSLAVERGEADEAVGEAVDALVVAVDELRPLEWEIELAGGRKVRAAADDVMRLTTQARVAAEAEALSRGDAASTEAANKAVDEAIEAVEEFKRQARAEIGVND
jgi:hypothetical protein